MSKRYFINNLDTKFGQALLNELQKEAAEDPVHMCTMRDPNLTKPRGIKKILKREKPKLSRKKMLEEADVYIYNVDGTDLSDVNFGLGIFDKPVDSEKVLILVSNIMSWSGSDKKVKVQKKPEPQLNEDGSPKDEVKENLDEPKEAPPAEEKQLQESSPKSKPNLDESEEDKELSEEAPPKPIEYTFYDDKDYKLETRQALPQYAAIKQIEDKVLELKKENVKVYVICSGITYGQGQEVFYELFKAAWLQQPKQLPYLGEGENQIPTIHISDLAKFVIKVAQSPPEESPYLLAFDDAKSRTQKSIVESISKGVGSGYVVSVQSSPLLENRQIFTLDIDIRPSKLLVGTAEEPVQFDWTCKNGLQDNAKRVLQQFCQTHKLRPLNIITLIQEKQRNDKACRYEPILNDLQKEYRTPILRIQELIIQARKELQGELKEDLEDELTNILNYLSENKSRPLDETLKVLYRVVRWRLSMNDCACRGYIFDNYPRFEEEIKHIFIPLAPSKLKRKIKRKPKVQIVVPVQPQPDPDGQEFNEDEKQPQEEKTVNNIPADDKLVQEKPVEEKQPEPEPQPQPQPEPEPEAEDDGVDRPKKEKFYPESIIKFNKLTDQQEPYHNEVVAYFSCRDIDELVYDPIGKSQLEIFESLRSYIERNGRPDNYLITEQELFERHQQHYRTLDQQSKQRKSDQQQQETKASIDIRKKREDIAKEVQRLIKHEGEFEIKKMPFRNYLMEFVVPILNEGLLQVSNIIPDDPVELLAEYLYQKSYDV